MSQNPINLGVRFLLELAALAALGFWGWTQHTGVLRYLLAIVLPLFAAFMWERSACLRMPARMEKLRSRSRVGCVYCLKLRFSVLVHGAYSHLALKQQAGSLAASP